MTRLATAKGKRLRSLLTDALFILAGSVLYAASVNLFTAPNNIAPGGITGLATILSYLSGDRLPIGITILAQIGRAHV